MFLMNFNDFSIIYVSLSITLSIPKDEIIAQWVHHNYGWKELKWGLLMPFLISIIISVVVHPGLPLCGVRLEAMSFFLQVRKF